MLPNDVLKQAAQVVALYKIKGRKLALAESCTGGLVAAAITSVSGASDMFERGFVTYANEAKSEEIGVPPALLRAHGAVSEECALAMAKGARSKARADVGLSITGVAGPTGGSDKKPVGLVYIGMACPKGSGVKKFNFKGDRASIRHQAVAEALAWLLEREKKF
ncbi:MAG: CinA family protein [Proteobacteria bacterium]|nr:CinA family protein [Pseudomonadota bacterium]